MPNFNGEKFLESAINSVRHQTERDWELLVADDGSSDDSIKVVEALSAEDPRIKLLESSARTGPAPSRNRAIEHATGRYLAFLDSDDQWHAEKLAAQLDLHRERSCSLTFTAMQKMDASGNLDPRLVMARSEVSYNQLLTRNYLPCSSVIVDRERTGPIRMPDFYRRQDFALWLQILRQTGEHAHGCSKPLLFYRVHAESFSASKLIGAMYHWRVLRQQERLSRLAALSCFAHYAMSAGFEHLTGVLRLRGATRVPASNRGHRHNPGLKRHASDSASD